jgi:hypothetical protein
MTRHAEELYHADLAFLVHGLREFRDVFHGEVHLAAQGAALNQSLREAVLAGGGGGWLAVMAGGGEVMMTRACGGYSARL